ESAEQIHISVFPTVHERHQIASRHYAFEGRTFVLTAGAIFPAGDLPGELEAPANLPSDALLQRGGSAIIAPDGTYLVEPVFDKEQTLIATLDLNQIIRESLALDVTGHYSRPDVFDLTVNRQRKPRT
ncbi:MAG TPA: nitrilase-related carbon-nitrogen hydrolase, partial [Phototrophicaceae bacterium]|nr:nitrilase-related carbon-nitrogen hydrolase [Phototrophicaceae bacterium]